MKLLRPYRHHLSACGRQLFLLQSIILLRPFLGGAGFMLVIPAISFTLQPFNISNAQLAAALSLLPELQNLSTVLMLFFILMLLSAALTYWQNITAAVVEQQLMTGIRKDIYHAAMNADWQLLRQSHQADYTRIITDEIDAVTMTFDALVQLVSSVVLILAYTTFCLYLSAPVTIIAIILGMGLVLATFVMRSWINRTGQQHLEASEKLYRLASDHVKGIRHVKSSATEAMHMRKFNTAVDKLSGEDIRYARFSELSRLLNSTISTLVFCVLAYAIVVQFEEELPLIVILALIFARLMPQVNQVQSIIQRLAYLQPSLSEVSSKLEQLNRHQEPALNPVTFDLTRGIILDGISYRYTSTGPWTLKDLCCSINIGQLIVINGSSGIGKSTLSDILGGITLPQAGSFIAGGVAVTTETQRAWRTQVSYVPQMPFLIEASVRDNLNLLRPCVASDAELWSALELASADFVSNLARGLDTVIGNDGVTLSGGERQRLELARALLDNRPVLVLDEITSHLDQTNELNVLATLEGIKKGRIVIIISHRQSLSAVADQVVSLNEAQDELSE